MSFLHPPSLPTRRHLLTALACTAACIGVAQAQPAAPLRVVASFSILADMAREVGGPDVEVHALVGPNTDAHVFQPTPADTRRMAAAELVVVNGLGFEGWIDRLVRASGYRGPLLVASAGITPRQAGGAHIQGRGHGHDHGNDPHVWQDLRLAQQVVLSLRDGFARARPAQAAGFAQRAQAYNARLQALDAQVRTRFDAIPRAQRRVLTSHDAFGYFGAAYGVDLLAPQGLNTDAEASASTVARLITQIRQGQVRAVFMENISNPRLVERIAVEARVVVGGRLYSDALSGPDGHAPTYLQLMAHNANTIAAALEAAR